MFSVMWWIKRIILLIIILFSVLFDIRVLVTSQVDTSQAEMSILMNSMLFSRNGIMETDMNTLSHNSLVFNLDSFSKLNAEERINSSLFTGMDKRASAKIRVSTIAADGGESLETEFYYNRAYFNYLQSIASIGSSASKNPGGAGGVDYLEESFFILLRKNGRLVPGVMDIQLYLSRS